MRDSVPSRLVFDGVSKSFPGVRALDDVSFAVEAGEVHGLIGENGAGKSTLLRVLSGVHRPDGGRISVDGREVAASTPLLARAAGIAMIHQELQHVPELTVAQNLFLGRPRTRAFGLVVDRRTQEAAAAAALAPLDPGIDPARPIHELKVAQRQLVEIARALIDQARVIAMDEPTSSLTPEEFERLVELIVQLAAAGVAIVYVSHRLNEVFRVCQRATILRDGRLVATVTLAETNERQVVAQMVGRELESVRRQSFATSRPALDVHGLGRGDAVVDASFEVHWGEVVGIAGLVGAGRTELLRLIAGVDRPTTGSVAVGDRILPRHDVRAAVAAGIGLVPEERKREGIVAMRPVASNMALPAFARFASAGLVRRGALRRTATDVMRRLGLRPLDVDRPIGAFSGGNQQKAVIGRWVAAGTDILLFDEPTRGVDVGAKWEIYALIERFAEAGKAIVVVSSELPELLRLADRVLVLREGRLVADLANDGLSEADVMAHAVPGLEAGGSIDEKDRKP
ncbi:MAG: sugar ABC transporter ATP-binding protein [Pseudomonadota bacterium]